ncbi:PolC-type DNA polymerase III [Mycoplasmoides alvi]|uniref:PolC-type DNA polymerase III n=1 Tax=Mycoplasmoides alvi TaxID=78580 RepID=UPI00051B9FA9|nr:PolC-type DNA polymerase III [Mycoplasmoides alvi]
MFSKIEQIILNFHILNKSDWKLLKEKIINFYPTYLHKFDLLNLTLDISDFLDPYLMDKLISNVTKIKDIKINFIFNVKKDINKNVFINYWNYFFIVKKNNLKISEISKKFSFNLIDNNTISLTFTNELEYKHYLNYKNDFLNFLVNYGFSKNLQINCFFEKNENFTFKVANEKTNTFIDFNKDNNTHNLIIDKMLVKTKITLEKIIEWNNIAKQTSKNLSDITENDKLIVINGKIFDINERLIKDTKIFEFKITDYTDSLFLIAYTKDNSNLDENYLKTFKVNDWIKVECEIFENKYRSNEICGKIKKIVSIDVPTKYTRIENAPKKKIEFSFHTKMSAFDGINDVSEYLKFANNLNWSHAAITDINNVQSYPEAATNANNVQVIYGLDCELLDNLIPIVLNPKNILLDDASYVIFDLETSGLYPFYDEIIEFGGIKIQNGIVVDKINFFINPGFKISNKISSLTKITNEMLQEKGLSIKDGLIKIADWIGDSVLVAHNGIDFDFQFLQTKLLQNNMKFLNNVMIDTLRISWSLNEQYAYHSLGSIARKLKIKYDETATHRADVDAEILYEIFKIFKNQLLANKIFNVNDLNNKLQNSSLRKRAHGYRALIYAKNQKGCKAIYELVSKSLTTNFTLRPKLYWQDLEPYRDNIVISCNPNEGEIFKSALYNNDDFLSHKISKYDFILISPPHWNDHLINANDLKFDSVCDILNRIIKLSKNNQKLVVATSDAYYINPWEQSYYKIITCTKTLNNQYHRFFRKNNNIDQFVPSAHLRTTDEMIEEFSFLKSKKIINEIVVENGHKVLNLFNFQLIEPIKKGLYPPSLHGSNDNLKELVEINLLKRYGKNIPLIIKDRIDMEMNSIINNGYGIIYWIAHLLVKRSNEQGYLVGSRGSVGSSLVATLSGISEINPLPPHYTCLKCKKVQFDNSVDDGFDLPNKKCDNCDGEMIGDGHDIPFETFMGLEGNKVPDIDLNFSGEYQGEAHNHVRTLFGDSHTLRAGTISTAAEKTTFGYVRNYFLDFSDQINNKKQTEIERYAKVLLGIKRTTGQHPGGIMVFPKEYDITDFTPYNYPADDTTSEWKTTHFAFEFLHDSLLKLDILGHDDPTMLKMLWDITGINPIEIPHYDHDVMQLFSGLKSLKINSNDLLGEQTGVIGIPEFGTDFVRRMLVDANPKSFADLIRISGLSHGTDVWANNAQTLIQKNNLQLNEVIACRDDIMTYLKKCGLTANDAFNIMELVRKGKSLSIKLINLMKEHNVPNWYIDSCKKIKYMFPKAHAAAYVLMAWRIAWFKINHPLEYYATLYSIKLTEHDIPTCVLGKEQVRLQLQSIQKRLNNPRTKKDVSKKEIELITTYESYLEMLLRGFKMSPILIDKSLATKFVVIDNQIIPPFTTIHGLGDVAAESIVNARNEKMFTSILDLASRTKLTKTHINELRTLNILSNLPEDDSIKLFS